MNHQWLLLRKLIRGARKPFESFSCLQGERIIMALLWIFHANNGVILDPLAGQCRLPAEDMDIYRECTESTHTPTHKNTYAHLNTVAVVEGVLRSFT